MENKTYEVCPYCGEEVELDAELKVQKCPSCGKHIVTCSMCQALSDMVEDCCKGCPLEYLAHKTNEDEREGRKIEAKKKKKKTYEVFLYLDADIDERIEAETPREALDIMLDKYRNMSNEELLLHIGYYRSVRNVGVYDDETGKALIGNEEYSL